MEHDIGAIGNERVDVARISDVDLDAIDPERSAVGILGPHGVGEEEMPDRAAAERPVEDEPFRQLAADHSRGTGDQDPHSSVAYQMRPVAASADDLAARFRRAGSRKEHTPPVDETEPGRRGAQ